jgi:hypothetical protein
VKSKTVMKNKLLNRIYIPLIFTLGIASEFTIISIFNQKFFLQDDSGISGYPMLKYLGDSFLQGNFSPFIPEIWSAGNLWVEAQYGLLNPITYVWLAVAGSLDSILVLSILWKFFYCLMLASGAYRVFRAYGIAETWAVLLGLLVPISGYILYFDIAAWGIELLGFAWLLHLWASIESYLENGRFPLSVPIFGWLLVSAGYPYAVFPLLFLVPWFIAREAKQKSLWQMKNTFFMLLGFMFLFVSVYLPNILSGEVNSRSKALLVNDGAWSISPGRSLFGIASPSLLPDLQTNGDPNFTNAPIFYVSILFAVVLPFLDIKLSSLRNERVIQALALSLISIFAMSISSNFWQFRWPFRFLPLFAVASLLVIGILVKESRWSASPTRLRAGLLAITFIVISSTLMNPLKVLVHFQVGAIMLITFMVIAICVERGRLNRVIPTLFFASLAVLTIQMYNFPNNGSLRDYNPNYQIDPELKSRFNSETGNIFEILNYDSFPASALKSGKIWEEVTLGSWPALYGAPILNHYSASGFKPFDDALCLQPNGSTCPDAFSKISNEIPGFKTSVGELLGINTVIVQVSNVSEVMDLNSGGEWKLKDCQIYTCTLVRKDSVKGSPIAFKSETMNVSQIYTSQTKMTFELDGEGSIILLNRLNWAGYNATLNGKPIETGTGPAGLVQIVIPDDYKFGSELVVEWNPPGLNAIKACVALSIFMMLLSTVASRTKQIKD